MAKPAVVKPGDSRALAGEARSPILGVHHAEAHARDSGQGGEVGVLPIILEGLGHEVQEHGQG